MDCQKKIWNEMYFTWKEQNIIRQNYDDVVCYTSVPFQIENNKNLNKDLGKMLLLDVNFIYLFFYSNNFSFGFLCFCFCCKLVLFTKVQSWRKQQFILFYVYQAWNQNHYKFRASMVWWLYEKSFKNFDKKNKTTINHISIWVQYIFDWKSLHRPMIFVVVFGELIFFFKFYATLSIPCGMCMYCILYMFLCNPFCWSKNQHNFQLLII